MKERIPPSTTGGKIILYASKERPSRELHERNSRSMKKARTGFKRNFMLKAIIHYVIEIAAQAILSMFSVTL